MDRTRTIRDEALREVEANYEHFLENLANLLATHRREWCLLRNRQIIDFYPTMEDAYQGGLSRFPDRRFSLQEVCGTPLNMGSHAIAL